MKKTIPHEEVEKAAAGDRAALEAFYRDLHEHPELSCLEERTSGKLAVELRSAGYEVTEKVGGFGVVGLMKNGAGPTVLVRADMDALPIKEETGLAFASQVRANDRLGREVPVMHACGHDLHTTVLVGTARSLARWKSSWSGTLVLIGQPAEEIVIGAKAMLAAGLFERFPKPDFALGLHDSPALVAGKVGLAEGYVMANVDVVLITVRGKGGHGAYPHLTKDPVVLAARIILALQTIVSRELNPIHSAVITVGSIHGGTVSNIIPEAVELQVTVRSYGDQVRAQVLEAIERTCLGEAMAAGMPENLLPIVEVAAEGGTPACFNDPALTQRVRESFVRRFGADRVQPMEPSMGGEDFGVFGRTAEKVPLCFFWLGAVPPEKLEESKRSGVGLPGLHSPRFAPVLHPTIEVGVSAMTAAVMDLMPL